MKYKVAVLIPCYNEEESIAELYKRLKAAFNKFKKKINSYSIYFISDGSTDNTVKEVKKVIKNDSNVELLDLKKSGKSIALQVGFSAIKDDVDLVFMMDGDLQDDPKEIGRFIEKIESGYDLVSGYKKIRLDNLEKRTASKVYNKSLNIIFRMNLHDHNCGFKCFKKEVVDKLKIYDNRVSYYDTIDEAIKKCDFAMIITEWDEIVSYDLNKYRKYMKKPIIFDGRNCYNLEDAKKSKIVYYSIGRKKIGKDKI